MRKKVSCKVIKSVSLYDSNLSELLSDINCITDTNLKANESFFGLYTSSGRLNKIKIFDNNIYIARILDFYI